MLSDREIYGEKYVIQYTGQFFGFRVLSEYKIVEFSRADGGASPCDRHYNLPQWSGTGYKWIVLGM